MGTLRGFAPASSFALRAAAWSLGLFGLLRVGWVETHVLLPLTRLQGGLAAGLTGTPALPIEITLACSGADALALCLGAILAYPASWRTRLAGAGGGLALILGLNILRIGTLGRVAASPTWFETIHLYVWPAALTLAIACYVFAWMRFAGRRKQEVLTEPGSARITRRFVFITAALLVLFTATSPIYLQSASVLAVAAFVARAAAAVLRLLGVDASAAANLLLTPRGGFVVTQECISTPLIAVYVAAVLAYSRTWSRRALGLLATGPLFVGLGIARLLVVALPAALVASPVFLIHAFYQLLLGAVVVFLAALWRHRAGGTAARRALIGTIVGVIGGIAVSHLFDVPYTRLATAAVEQAVGAALSIVAARPSFEDPQGAIGFLPAFQFGLYVAVWVAAFVDLGWRRFLAGLALLELTAMMAFVAFHVLASHAAVMINVRDVRAWAVVGPLLVILVVANVRPRRARTPDAVRIREVARA